MGRLTYVREGTSRKEAFKAQERIREKQAKKGTFFRPSRVYGRKPRVQRRSVRRVSNPSGVSVFRRVAPSRRSGDRKNNGGSNGQQSATDWLFG